MQPKDNTRNFLNFILVLLHEHGIIITDNVLFKGLVAEEVIEHKRTDQLVKEN